MYNTEIEAKVRHIAELNNVDIINDDMFYNWGAGAGATNIGIHIVSGTIIYRNFDANLLSDMNERDFWSIILHELCHILVVEPQYRELMHIDTVDSYKKINAISKRPYHSESATLGLNKILLRLIGEFGSVYGSFWGGTIYNPITDDTDVYSHWVEKAQDTEHTIFLPDFYYIENIKSEYGLSAEIKKREDDAFDKRMERRVRLLQENSVYGAYRTETEEPEIYNEAVHRAQKLKQLMRNPSKLSKPELVEVIKEIYA